MQRRPKVSDTMREDFERDGYVLLPGFLSEEKLAELLGELARFIRDTVPGLGTDVYYEDKERTETLKQIQRMHQHDPYFKNLIQSEFKDVAESLLHGPVVKKNMQYFNKPPQIGQPTPPHQDGFYFMIEPCEAVTMWLALEDVDEDNGCVRYVRGSHKRCMRPHSRTQTLGFSQGITDYGTESDIANETPLPAKAGDLLVHHALTIHRADGNQDRVRSRRAMGVIYYSKAAKEDTAAHDAYQKRLREEMKGAGKL